MAYIIFVNPSILATSRHGSRRSICCHLSCRRDWLLDHGPLCTLPNRTSAWYGLKRFFHIRCCPRHGLLLGTSARGGVFIWYFIHRYQYLPYPRMGDNAIPSSLKLGIAAGIGLFLAMIAPQNSGIIVKNPATMVSLGDLSSPSAIYGLLGFLRDLCLVLSKCHWCRDDRHTTGHRPIYAIRSK